mgnify:CR=1 FL=1
MIKLRNYLRYYDKTLFFKKIYALIKEHGSKKIIREALSLYYCLKDQDTPKWLKVLIIAGLGYFILPTDLIPDFIPMSGFIDDLAILTFISKKAGAYIQEKHRNKADGKINKVED